MAQQQMQLLEAQELMAQLVRQVQKVILEQREQRVRPVQQVLVVEVLEQKVTLEQKVILDCQVQRARREIRGLPVH